MVEGVWAIGPQPVGRSPLVVQVPGVEIMRQPQPAGQREPTRFVIRAAGAPGIARRQTPHGSRSKGAAFMPAARPGESRVLLPPDASMLAGTLPAPEQGSVHVWEQDIGDFPVRFTSPGKATNGHTT
jgi:hypothetical protein